MRTWEGRGGEGGGCLCCSVAPLWSRSRLELAICASGRKMTDDRFCPLPRKWILLLSSSRALSARTRGYEDTVWCRNACVCCILYVLRRQSKRTFHAGRTKKNRSISDGNPSGDGCVRKRLPRFRTRMKKSNTIDGGAVPGGGGTAAAAKRSNRGRDRCRHGAGGGGRRSPGVDGRRR